MATEGVVKPQEEPSISASFFNALPVIPGERLWGYVVYIATGFSIVTATWSFLIGGAVSQFVGGKLLIGVALFGSVPFYSLVGFSVMVCYWYGLDPFIAARTMFGKHGAALPLLALLTSGMGWITMIEIMFGKAIMEMLRLVGLGLEGAPYTIVFILSNLFFVFLVWLITWKGPLAIKYTNLVIAPILFLIVLWMFIELLTTKGWSGIAAVTPQYASGDLQLDGMTGIELVAGVAWSWWPFAGVWMRLARKPGVALVGTTVGQGIGFAPVMILAAIAGLVVGTYDPTLWLAEIGGALFAVGALIFIAFANIGSDVGQLYPVSVAVQHWSWFAKMKWPYIIAIMMIPPILISPIDPDAYFSIMGNFLLYNAILFCPIAAIYISDFWILRKRKLNVLEIYKTPGIYNFIGGINPVSIIAWVVGVGVYMLLLNPVSLQGPAIFKFISASGPSFIATMVVYIVLTKVWLIPKGIGGYRETKPELGAEGSGPR